MLIRISVDEVMWCRQQSVNHQGLLCNQHCATTVVLREQLNFRSAVIRSERSSQLFLLCFVYGAFKSGSFVIISIGHGIN